MTSQHDKPKRWRPWQFGLSTLLMVTAVVAVAVGWWMDRKRLIKEIEAAHETAATEAEKARLAEAEARVAEIEAKEMEAIAIAEVEKARKAEAKAKSEIERVRRKLDQKRKQSEQMDASVSDVPIQLNSVLLQFSTSPDAKLIKALHDRSEESLLANLGITTDENGLTVGRVRKKLVFHSPYKLRDEHRLVFVYDPCIHIWPGTQPQTIVICDASYRPLNWIETGGSPMFEQATLELAGTTPVLYLTRRHRHTMPNPKRGTYGFSLGDDKIKPLPKVDWLYENDAERDRYDRWRKAPRGQGDRLNRVAR